MKKFILTLMLVLTLTVSAYAANSEDVYVRKDVFDVHLQSINSKLELILSEMQSFKAELQTQRNEINELAKAVSVLSERTDRNFETLSSRIDGVNSRIDDLRNGLYLWLVVIGTFIAFLTLVISWPKAKDFLQSRNTNKHDFTLQDVENLVTRLIDAKLNSKS